MSNDAFLACQQLVCWVDTRRNEIKGEYWWESQPTDLREAYQTARRAIIHAAQPCVEPTGLAATPVESESNSSASGSR